MTLETPPDSQSYCITCEDGPRGSDSRNLVICIDGTSNQFGPHNTNVIELYSQLVKDRRQLTYYDSGIGTYAQPSWKSWNYWKQVVDNKIDLAIAWNFETLVINAYSWLADNYQPGDRIFLFGFSRGAYQSRALAGMIHKVGLIHRGNERQIPFAYEIYADFKSDKPFSRSKKTNPSAESEKPSDACASEPPSTAKRFKDTFSRDVKVHFVGVWDTVSSIGIIKGKNLPGTVSQEHICYFRHALALDERRVKFLPEYAHGGVMLDADVSQQVESSSGSEGSSSRPRVKETWFTGTHSDIGGGNVLNPDLDRSGAPLHWMSYEAISAGLLMKPSNMESKWEQFGDVHESLRGVWKLFEYLPFNRLSYKDPDSMTMRLHRGKGRKIQHGQKIHASVAFSPSKYRPTAVLPKDRSPLKWEHLNWLHGPIQEDWEGWLEMDMAMVQTVISNLASSDVDLRTSVHRLTVMTQSAVGCGALRGVTDAAKKVFLALHRDDIKNDIERQVEILAALTAFATEIPGIDNRESLIFLLPMLQQPCYSQTAERFITRFCEAELKLLASFGLSSTLQDVIQHDTRIVQKPVIQAIKLSLSNNSKISQSDTLKALLAMLEGKEKLLSLRAIIELAKHGDNPSEAFEPLVKTLQDKDCDVRRLAFIAIEQLLRRGDLSHELLNSNLVEDASDMLKGHERRLALDIITMVAGHEDRYGQIVKSDTLTSLLEALANNSWILRCCALEAIIGLAKHGGFCSRMAETDVPACLFGFLHNWGEPVRLTSVNAITTLVEFDDIRSQMAETDFPTRLFGLLQNLSRDVRQSSIDVITALAKFDDFRSKIIKTDVLAYLFSLLTNQSSDVQLSSIEAIAALAKFDDSCSKMTETDVLARLLGLLQDRNKDVQLSSVNAITILVKFDDFRSKMIETDIFAHLLDSLQDKSLNIQWTSIEVIAALVKFDDFRSKMVETDVFAHLLRLVQDLDLAVQHSSIKVIIALAEFDYFRSKMAETAVLAYLFDLLQDKSGDIQRSSIKIIIALARFDDFCSKMVETDVPTRLLGLLRDRSWDVQESSIQVITALAESNDFRSKMETDVFPHLPDLLQDRDLHVRQSSIEVIIALAKFDDFRSKMIKIDLLAHLLDLLLHRDLEVQGLYLKVIIALAKFDDFRSKMIETDLLTHLLDLLQHRDLEVQGLSIKIIIALAKFDDFHSKMVETDVLAHLLRLVQDRQRKRLLYIDVITALVEFNDFHSRMVEADVVACLVTLVGYLLSLDLHESSAKAIITLAKFDSFYSKMVEFGILFSLVDSLQHRLNQHVRESHFQVITAMVESNHFSHEMLNAQTIQQLVKMIEGGDASSQQFSTNIIGRLAKYDGLRSSLHVDITPSLINNLKYGQSKLQCSSIDCVAQYAKHDVLDASRWPDVFNVLLPYFRCDRYNRNVEVQQACLRCISQSFERDHCRSALLEAGLFGDLMGMLEDNDHDCRALSLQAIAELAKYDDFRDLLCEYTFVTSMVGIIQFFHYREEQRVLLDAVEELAKYEETRSRLLRSRFTSCLVATLSRLATDGLAKEFPPDLLRSFIACVTELKAHEDSRSEMTKWGFTPSMLEVLQDSAQN